MKHVINVRKTALEIVQVLSPERSPHRVHAVRIPESGKAGIHQDGAL